MLLIKEFLRRDEVAGLRAVLNEIDFIDGGGSAGAVGRTVKNNLQANQSHPAYPKANQIIREAISRSELIQIWAFPKLVTPVRFSRYGTGMAYGEHLDASIMPLSNNYFRADISFTVFLSPPDEYEGGELAVRYMGAEKIVKGDAGDIFIYPSGHRHEVQRVTAGVREAGIGWMQSLYPSQEQRRVLYDLTRVHETLLRESGPSSPQLDRVNEALMTLVRMWARP